MQLSAFANSLNLDMTDQGDVHFKSPLLKLFFKQYRLGLEDLCSIPLITDLTICLKFTFFGKIIDMNNLI